jgi:hypothetical protein
VASVKVTEAGRLEVDVKKLFTNPKVRRGIAALPSVKKRDAAREKMRAEVLAIIDRIKAAKKAYGKLDFATADHEVLTEVLGRLEMAWIEFGDRWRDIETLLRREK